MSKQKKILIIEDDINIQKAFSKLIKDEGYLVHTTKDGKAGLSKARKTYYDLIYTGMLMPSLNGVDLLKKLKEENIKKTWKNYCVF